MHRGSENAPDWAGLNAQMVISVYHLGPKILKILALKLFINNSGITDIWLSLT